MSHLLEEQHQVQEWHQRCMYQSELRIHEHHALLCYW